MQFHFVRPIRAIVFASLVLVSLGALAAQTNAKSGFAASINGSYQVDGTNADGSKYSGVCTIAYNADKTYSFMWQIGSDKFQGTGTLDGRVLTVDWGQGDPVIYQVSGDGKRLDGVWDGGAAKEILTR